MRSLRNKRTHRSPTVAALSPIPSRDRQGAVQAFTYPMRSLLAFAVFGSLWLSPAVAQPTMHLTLAEAQRLAIQNNPQFTAAKFNAAAAYQVPPQYRSNFEPTVFGSLTGVGADNGSRLAAGGLNNPVVYDRVA